MPNLGWHPRSASDPRLGSSLGIFSVHKYRILFYTQVACELPGEHLFVALYIHAAICKYQANGNKCFIPGQGGWTREQQAEAGMRADLGSLQQHLSSQETLCQIKFCCHTMSQRAGLQRVFHWLLFATILEITAFQERHFYYSIWYRSSYSSNAWNRHLRICPKKCGVVWVFFGLKSNNHCWQYSLSIVVTGFGKESLTVKHFLLPCLKWSVK